MRIAYISDRITPFYFGGYERRVWEILRRCGRTHDVTVFTAAPRDMKIETLNIKRVTGLLEFRTTRRIIGQELLFTLKLLLRVLRETQTYDVIHCNGTPFVHCLAARILAIKSKAPLVVTIHEAWDYDYFLKLTKEFYGSSALSILKSLLAFLFYQLSLIIADVLEVPSDYTRSHLEVRTKGKQIVVIHNGVNISMINSCQIVGVRRKSCFNIVTTARLSPEKNIDDAVRAIALLTHSGIRDVKLHVIGTGPIKSNLAAIVHMLGLDNEVVFHGSLPDLEMVKLMSKADVFVLTSSREGFSISCLEALACGLPVIAAVPPESGVFGTSEIVKDGYNGLYFPLHDSTTLATLLGALAQDEHLRSRLAAAARSVAKSFDWELVASRAERFYRGLRFRRHE